MIRRARLVVALAFLAGAVTGCGGDGVSRSDDTMGGGPTVTFTALQQTIFTPSCAISGAGCHIGAGAPLGLDLSEGQAYANLVGVPSQQNGTFARVEPFEPDLSYLFLKITGDPQISGGQMPLIGGPLSSQQMADVATWILEGAEAN